MYHKTSDQLISFRAGLGLFALISFALLQITGCNSSRQSAFFTGTVQYRYSYESDSLNVDTLTKMKPLRSKFRFDSTDYQSIFEGADTQYYYYSEKRNRCLARDPQQAGMSCEDYGIATDSVISYQVYNNDETVLGHPCIVLEFKSKLFTTIYHVATDIQLSPTTYNRHLAYNWKFYAEQTGGGLILKTEHRFKKYTMKGVAESIQQEKPGFKALEIQDSNFDEFCR